MQFSFALKYKYALSIICSFLIFFNHILDGQNIPVSSLRSDFLLSENHNQFSFSDLHNSTLQRLYWNNNLHDLNDDRWPVSISSIKKANSKLIFMSLGFSEFDMRHSRTPSIEEIIKFLRTFRDSCSIIYPSLSISTNHTEAVHTTKQGRIAIILSLEGTSLLNGNVDWIDSLYSAGIRMITIVHNFHNDFIKEKTELSLNITDHSDLGVPSIITNNSTLTTKGKELVNRMISMNMLIDVSHLKENAFWEVVNINGDRMPLIASHSNVFALCDTARNLKDAQIKAIAKTNGLIGICLHSPYLNKIRKATLADIVDHIEYIIELVGPEHVAIGTDLEGGIQLPYPLKGQSDIVLISDELVTRGYSEEVIKMVMWENILRVIPD